MLGGETAQDLAHKRRQFIFVGATIPQNGKHTPGALLKKWYPNSTWVEGSQLHRSVRDVTHEWKQVRGEPPSPADPPLPRLTQSPRSIQG
jgi:hypothetical protein